MTGFITNRRLLSLRLLQGAALAAAAPSLSNYALAREDARAPASAVLRWNSVASGAFAPSQGTNPMAQSRVFAILHAAIHDALNAIEPRYAPYTPAVSAAPLASPEAAVAAAAREVLVALVPQQAAAIETAYGRALAPLRDAAPKTAGLALGRAAALTTLERRRQDGADRAGEAYVPRSGPGEYRFTPPFDFAAQPGWGRVDPFAISLREHRLPGPLPLDSADYARDVAEVKEIGHAESVTRTAEQSEIARFWYEDSPLGWNRIANQVIGRSGLDAWQAARAFALLHFAMADGFIAGFAEKYRHRFWRPETAIRAAADDGNPLTTPDPGWQPFLVTPPVPDYPSTHTVLGWAAAEVLIALLGDGVPYELTSLTLPGVTRSYRGFSTAAEENGLSRLYAGIHFRHAIAAGRRQGQGIGRAVAQALPPSR
ncbi:vanadium-dependent haloperoxidase [Falsiroseomonas sp. HW251]|uniref:vanadium-dependent haloperoxidase n=1 Tax=Falsiroseomonas sp. HW251 TaxID=3390998 RepID=UPI003D312DC2